MTRFVLFERQNLCESVGHLDECTGLTLGLQETRERRLERRMLEAESGGLEHTR